MRTDLHLRQAQRSRLWRHVSVLICDLRCRKSEEPRMHSAIISALQSGSGITEVRLAKLLHGDDANGDVESFAVALASSNLTSWSISSSKLEPAGAVALANAIQTSCTLSRLTLHHLEMSDASASALAEAIQSSRTLTSVSHRQNRLTNVGRAALDAAELHILQHHLVQPIADITSPDEARQIEGITAIRKMLSPKHNPPIQPVKCRNLILNAGVLQPLLALCARDATITLLRLATWLLSNLCRGKPKPDFALVHPSLPVLAQLLSASEDHEIMTDVCWALSHLSDDKTPGNQQIQAVIQSGVVTRLVDLLAHCNPEVQLPAVRAVGNICTGDDVQTEAILSCDGVLDRLRALLVSPNKSIRKEACWTISNITAGSTDHIERVIQANIIPPLLSLFRKDELEVKKEAAWVISNAIIGGTDAQIRDLTNQAVIHPLCDSLHYSDPQLIFAIMECLQCLLRVCAADAVNDPQQAVNLVAIITDTMPSALDRLKSLRQHDDEDISSKAIEILKTYFVGANVGSAGQQTDFAPTPSE